MEEDNPCRQNKARVEHRKWEQRHRQARAFIGFSLFDDTFDDVKGSHTSKYKLSNINTILQRRKLIKNMRVPFDFHNAEMRDSEGMMSCTNRVTELGSIIESMRTTVHAQKVATVVQ